MWIIKVDEFALAEGEISSREQSWRADRISLHVRTLLLEMVRVRAHIVNFRIVGEFFLSGMHEGIIARRQEILTI